MNHKTGPWQTEVEEETDRLLVTDEQDVTVAEILDNPLDPDAWAINDQKLIAAAPDMFEQLTMMARVWQEGGDDSNFGLEVIKLLKQIKEDNY